MQLINVNDVYAKFGRTGTANLHVGDIDTIPRVDAVKLPCKMGDTVWGIKSYNFGQCRVLQGVVNQMFYGEDMRLCICVKGVCRGEWGKNVFATEEEANAVLERRVNG